MSGCVAYAYGSHLVDLALGDIPVKAWRGAGLPVCAPPSYTDQVLADGPGLYWRLGETSGSTVADSSGNGRTGSIHATGTAPASGLLPGDSNGARDFFGTGGPFAGGGGTVTRAWESWMDDTTFTLEAIIKPDTVSGGSRSFISLDGASGSRSGIFMIDASRLTMSNQHMVTNVVGSTTLVAGTRYHAVFTADATHMKVYLNGVLDASVATPFSAPGATLRGFELGATAAGQTFGSFQQYPFDGVIDEAAWYPVALPADRILAHAQAAGLA